MLVMKFGGTSVGSPKMIRVVGEIIQENKEEHVVVVSAMNGITDTLIKAANLASKRDKTYLDAFNSIKEKHLSTMQELFNENFEEVLNLLDELQNILQSIFILGELSKKALDTIVSFGEKMNARIVSKYLQSIKVKSIPIDATNFIITDSNFGNALPIYEESEIRTKKTFQRLFKDKITPVITGFIGSDKEGNTTTLGRGGSDFSATIVGKLLDAKEVWIWTDTNGVMTGDPKIIEEAVPLKELSFNETAELSYYGAKVLHSRALLPVLDKKIPIRILNTFNRSFEGTVIWNREFPDGSVKAITAINGLTLLNIQGKGMLGLQGIFNRVFLSLEKSTTTPLMVTQASSLHNICIIVKSEEGENFLKTLKEEFKYELKEHLIEEISQKKNIAIVSVVGAGMKGTPGTAGKVFSTLGRFNINVIAIAQGSSEYSISFAIRESDVNLALNSLHAELGLASKKEVKTLNIFQFGVGSIGKAVSELILKNRENVEKISGIRIKYIGIQRKNAFAFGEEVEKILSDEAFDFKEKGKIKEGILLNMPKNTVFVDVTDSEELLDTLLKLKEKGYAIVTSNKKNFTQELSKFKALAGYKLLGYETTVGASLPIIKTIRELLLTGDEVYKIEMLPSGTLSFAFEKINKGEGILRVIEEAYSKGFTEPNPIEDLKGFDMLRKAMILARILDFEDNYNFVPFVKSNSLEEFKKTELKEFENRIAELTKEGIVFPVCEVLKKETKIYLRAFPENSHWAGLKNGENLFLIYTKRYGKTPIKIQGIGAGREITAMGVLNDIIQTGERL